MCSGVPVIKEEKTALISLRSRCSYCLAGVARGTEILLYLKPKRNKVYRSTRFEPRDEASRRSLDDTLRPVETVSTFEQHSFNKS